MDSIRIPKVENLTLINGSNRSEGTLHITPNHLIFITNPGSEQGSKGKGPDSELWIPYPHISLLTRLPLTIQNLSPLQLRTRVFENYLFVFGPGRDKECEDVWYTVKELGVVPTIDRLYAFAYRPSPPLLPIAPTTYTSSSSGATSPPSSSTPPSTSSVPSAGWTIYNPRDEFTRMGVGTRTKAWRFTDLNKDYQFSPTYPAKLVVPSKISDAVLVYAGKYRSKARIPALSYLHWANQATITRCSQPLVGFKNARSSQDERLVDSIFTSHLSPEATSYTNSTPTSQPSFPPSASGTSSPRAVPADLPSSSGMSYGAPPAIIYGATATNLIVDARPTANAMANIAVGAGSENMEYYKGGRKAYLGIDNIHVMRDSLGKLVEALRESESNPGGMIDRHMLRRSNWLKHISAILEGSLMIVRNIHINSSHVLVHCSDGWDRTAQLSAVAQICLDPFYRTTRGFQILIEKDWLSFGHKFLDRSGHLGSEKAFSMAPQPDDDPENTTGGAERAAQAFFASVQNKFASSGHSKEVSPVFHQFLDCVYQIQRQFPERFEFNGRYLEALHYHLYSCQFGTFIANNERQRRVKPTEMEKGEHGFTSQGVLWEKTWSIWDWIDQPDKLEGYANAAYDSSLDKTDGKTADADMGVLLPDPKNVKFWHELFKRTDEEMNGRRIIQEQLADADNIDAVGPIDAADADPVTDAGPKEIAQTAAAVAGHAEPRSQTPTRLQSSGWSNAEAQSTPTKTAAPDPRLRSSSGVPGSPSHSPARSSSRQSGITAGRGNSGSGGSWGWSQFSTGALSAIQAAGREIQGAAKEIKNISSEVYTNLAAPGDEERQSGGEMWDAANSRSTAANGTGRPAVADAVDPWGNPIRPAVPTSTKPATGRDWTASGSTARPERAGTRIPSEANPWATTSVQQSRSAPAMPSFGQEPAFTAGSASATSTQPSVQPVTTSRSSTLDYMATPSMTWGSVADRKAAVPLRPTAASAMAASPVEDVSMRLAGTRIEESEQKEKSKSWDPLGAL